MMTSSRIPVYPKSVSIHLGCSLDTTRGLGIWRTFILLDGRKKSTGLSAGPAILITRNSILMMKANSMSMSKPIIKIVGQKTKFQNSKSGAKSGELGLHTHARFVAVYLKTLHHLHHGQFSFPRRYIAQNHIRLAAIPKSSYDVSYSAISLPTLKALA